MLDGRVGQQQVPRSDPGGDDHLHPMCRRRQYGPQRLVQRGVGDRERAGPAVHEILEVVQKYHGPPAGKLFQKCAHHPRRRLLPIAVSLPQPIRGLYWQQPTQVAEQVLKVDRMRSRGQVHDAVDRQLVRLIRQMAALQGLQHPAYQRRLAHPTPADHGQQPLVCGSKEGPDQLSFRLPALEVPGGGHRRGVDQPSGGRPGGLRLRRPPLRLDPGRDPMLGPLYGGPRVLQQEFAAR